MKAKLVKESLDDNRGIPWSGRDVTTAPIIGKIKTKPIYHYPASEYQVVEITEANGHIIYICNFWNNRPGKPQIVGADMVDEYIEYDVPVEQEDPDKDFKRRWGSDSY